MLYIPIKIIEGKILVLPFKILLNHRTYGCFLEEYKLE